MEQYQSDHLELKLKSHLKSDCLVQTNHTSMFSNREHSTAQSDFGIEQFKLQFSQKQSSKMEQKQAPAKQPLKKGGKNTFKVPHYKQKLFFKKESNQIKGQLNKKIKESERKKRAYMYKKNQVSSSLANLHEKSLNLDQELKKISTNRLSSKNIKIISNQQMIQNNSLFIQSEVIAKAQRFTGQLETKTQRNQKQNFNNFDDLKNKLSSNKNLQICQGKSEIKKNICFYDRLKQRLSIQMEKITQKLKDHSVKQKVSKCQMKNNIYQDPCNIFTTSVTDRPRPATALTRSGLEIKRQTTPFKRKRPMSTQAKILENKQISYFHQKIEQSKNQKSKKSKTKLKNQRKIVSSSAVRFQQPQVTKTLRHVSPLYKQRNWSGNRKITDQQKLKQKMLTILIDCHAESKDCVNIQEGIKIFQSYSERLGNRLQKTNKLIDNIQRTQTIEVQYDYQYA